MRLTTDALIIRENNNIGEADRFVTALTRELGLVRAGRAANGYRRYGPAEVDRVEHRTSCRHAAAFLFPSDPLSGTGKIHNR